MNLDEFRATLKQSAPPDGLSPLLIAIWWDANGDWDQAHKLADEIGNQADAAGARDAAWVHAYLHRKEGDLVNAAYWYRRARHPVCRTSLDEEWEAIASALLQPQGK
jgi:hypothetical protein